MSNPAPTHCSFLSACFLFVAVSLFLFPFTSGCHAGGETRQGGQEDAAKQRTERFFFENCALANFLRCIRKLLHSCRIITTVPRHMAFSIPVYIICAKTECSHDRAEASSVPAENLKEPRCGWVFLLPKAKGKSF